MPSLTSYVELFFINSICGTEINQIDIFNFSEKPLRSFIYIKSLIPSNYVPYIATISDNSITLSAASYTNLVIRNTTYLLIANSLPYSSATKLYQLYTQSGGYSPASIEYRYRLAMSSRGKTFR